MPNPEALKGPNPAFKSFAASVREAAERLKKAADTAASQLCFPQMDFGRVRRHLESMAVCVEEEKVLLAYVKHNTLTDAPTHPRSLGRVRQVRKTSDRKKRAAIENGRKGGRSDSDLKKATARENGKLGGRPPKKSKAKVRRPVVSGEEPSGSKRTQGPAISFTSMELPLG